MSIGWGRRWNALLAAVLAAVSPLANARPPAATGEARTAYRCQSHANLPGTRTSLMLDKWFYEDGSVASMTVTWEDYRSEAVRRIGPRDHAIVTLHWPGDRFSVARGPLDWSRGTIAIHVFGQGVGAQNRPTEREPWRQVVADRDGSIQVFERNGVRSFYLGSEMRLSSDLLDRSVPGNLQMPLDSFLAWATGARRVTVYETLVTATGSPRRRLGSRPAGWRRIVAEYDVDVPALTQTVEQIREATRQWEASLTDFRTQCELSPLESEGGIVVT